METALKGARSSLSQGPRNLTIMAPITRDTYYASRDLCPIMESAPRDRPTITVPYYGKKALLRETVLTIIKNSLVPLSPPFTEHTRCKLSK